MKSIFFFLVFLVSRTAYCSCNYSLSMPAVSYIVTDINPSISQDFTLYRNSGGSKCNDFVVGFSRGGSSTYNRLATNTTSGATLSYNIYKTNSGTTALTRKSDSTSVNQIITGIISKKETKNLNYFFALGTTNSTQVIRAGTYLDTLQVEVGANNSDNHGDDEDGDDNAIESTQPLSVSIIVPKSISISLVDTGSVHDHSATSKVLDFGELSENEELGFDVKVVSNAGYTLSVSSANNQKMQLDGSTPSSVTQINYDFYTSGNLKNLSSSSSSPVNINSGSGSTPVLGVSVPVRVVIKSVENKNAGNYKDYVTFTVSTTE